MNRARRRSRRGSLIVCVVAVMAVVVSLMGLMVRDAVRARRETKWRLQLHQTERLLDAGILRAAKQFQADGEYRGETWQPSMQFGGESADARIEIAVEETRVHVTAKLGNESRVTTRSHVFEMRE